MSAEQPILTSLFAIPFAEVTLPQAIPLHAALLEQFSAREKQVRASQGSAQDLLCFRSAEDFFEWPAEPARALQREIVAGLRAAVRRTVNCSAAEFEELRVDARASFAVVHPSGAISAGSSPLASWTAIYCVAAPVPVGRLDSAALRLYAIRQPTMFMDPTNSQFVPHFGAGDLICPPVPGRIAIFPASVVHEIAVNRGTADLVLVRVRARFAPASQAVSPQW